MIPRRGSADWLAMVGALLIVGLTVVASVRLFAVGVGRALGDAPAVAQAPTAAPLPVALATQPPAAPAASPTTAPTPAPDRPLVCLDVGHGGVDLGKLLLNEEETEILFMEKDLVLAQALALEERLLAAGVDVVLTRRTDTEVNPTFADVNGDGETALDLDGDGRIETRDGDYPDELDELQARVNVCNQAGADLLVSMHINGAENLNLKGYEAWYAEGRPDSDQSARFAEMVTDALGERFAAAGYETVFRGAAPDSMLFLPDEDRGTFEHFVLLSPNVPERNFVGSTMPGVIVECLFLSNADDAPFVTSPEGQESVVSAYADAILAYFGEAGVRAAGGPSPRDVPTPTLPAAVEPSVAATRETADGPTPTARLAPPPDAGTGQSQLHYYGDSGRREIALTFDLGSDRGYTEQVLDFLAERGILASFGMTGRWADENPDLVRRIAADGHMLFNHTWSHCSFTGASQPECQLTSEERLDEIRRTEDVIREITGGYDTRPYFRPPYGDTDDASLRDVLAAGYHITVMWTCDTLGWKQATPAEIVQRCAGTAEPGGILLLHVGSDGTDQEALPFLVDQLTADGYAFVTVEQILQP